MMTDLMPSFVRSGGTLAVALMLLVGTAHAGCRCGGQGNAVYGPVPASDMLGEDVYAGAVADPQWFGGEVVSPLPMTPEVGPPPGTLGQTYQRVMRPIPVDKHPRISILAIQAPGATSIKVYGTNEFRSKDTIPGFQDRRNAAVWRFESEPLVPGVSNIYRVEAKYGDSVQERYVRLVPGRVVTLEF